MKCPFCERDEVEGPPGVYSCDCPQYGYEAPPVSTFAPHLVRQPIPCAVCGQDAEDPPNIYQGGMIYCGNGAIFAVSNEVLAKNLTPHEFPLAAPPAMKPDAICDDCVNSWHVCGDLTEQKPEKPKVHWWEWPHVIGVWILLGLLFAYGWLDGKLRDRNI